jgi:outer membrane protein assembly factor BamB
MSPGMFRCPFCGTSYRDAPQAAPPQPVRPPANVVIVRPSAGGCAIPLVVGAAVLVVAGAGVAMVLLRGAPSAPPKAASKGPAKVVAVPDMSDPDEAKPGKSSKSKSKNAAPKDESRPRWASDRVFPVGADVDGDGVEDLVGPTVRVDGANAQLWVSAFDGKDFHVRWNVGPFGAAKSAGDVEMKLPVVVAGKRFVVLDPKRDAHLYELDTGKLVSDFPFREDTRGMCGPPASEPKVLVRVGDGDFLIDTATGIGRAGAPPAWCANNRYFRRRPSESFNGYYGVQSELLQDFGDSRARLAALKPPPKVSVSVAFADGPLTIALGSLKGSDESVLLGFDDKGALAYQVAGPTIGLTGDHHRKDLGFGRFVFVRGDGAVVAIDAKTGEKSWETKLDGAAGTHPAKLSLTASRVWLTRHDEPYAVVVAIDAATGKLLGVAGD